jgi:DNA polymerase-3 subunit delta
MKIYADRLGSSLKAALKKEGKTSSFPSCILLFGSDEQVIEESFHEILSILQESQPLPLEVISQTGGTLLANPFLLKEYGEPGLFKKGMTVVSVEDLSERLASHLEEWEKENLGDLLVILQGPNLKTTSKLVKFCTASPRAFAVGCYAPDKEVMSRKIQEKVAAGGMTLEPQAREFLVYQDLGGYGEVMAAVEKLLLYGGGEGVLTLQAVEACCLRPAEGEIEKLVAGILGRHPQVWGAHLQAVETDHIMLLLRILNTQFLKLLDVHGHVRRGLSVEEAIQALRPPVFFKQVPLFKSYMKEWSAAQLLKAIETLAQIEKDFKTSSPMSALQNGLIHLTIKAAS